MLFNAKNNAERSIYIWYIFENENYNIEDYVLDFQKKTEFKKLNPKELFQTVQNKKGILKKGWGEHLVNQIKEVPDFEDAWRCLGKHWRKFEKVL